MSGVVYYHYTNSTEATEISKEGVLKSSEGVLLSKLRPEDHTRDKVLISIHGKPIPSEFKNSADNIVIVNESALDPNQLKRVKLNLYRYHGNINVSADDVKVNPTKKVKPMRYTKTTKLKAFRMMKECIKVDSISRLLKIPLQRVAYWKKHMKSILKKMNLNKKQKAEFGPLYLKNNKKSKREINARRMRSRYSDPQPTLEPTAQPSQSDLLQGSQENHNNPTQVMQSSGSDDGDIDVVGDQDHTLQIQSRESESDDNDIDVVG